MKAVEILKEKGVDADVVNARFIKPMDEKLLDSIVGKRIITVEDGVRTGGFGEGVIAYYAEKGISASVTVKAFNERPYPQGSVDYILSVTGLDAQGIAKTVMENSAQ